MNATAVALAGYIGWFLFLLAVLAAFRVYESLVKHKPANSFRPDGSDLSPFVARLCRVHANCYESFPFVGGALILALATNMTAITNPLAMVVLGARIAQSTVHLASLSVVAVNARFTLFIVQYAIVAYWLVQFLAGA